MGLAIPQVVTSDRASGAQVIDGSLKFDGPSNQHLTRTPSSSGNTKTWTVSFWTKLNDIVGYQYFASAGGTDTNSLSGNDFTLFQQDNGASTIYFQDYRSSTTKWAIDPTDVFRDPNGWYHFLIQLDTPNSTVKLYVNNRLITSGTTTNPSSNYEGYWNSNAKHRISDGTYGIGAQLSQFYNIDGQALTPESFGYTDGLTNTWRPKKYTGTFGTNGFYLPMDGNSPIGEDKSGKGNNWTPVNFGGSNSLEKATGAKPILNTDGGGNVARPGVFGSEENLFYTVTTANGSVYQFDITSGNNPSLSFIRGATYRFDYTSHSSHPLRFSSTNPDSSTSAYTDGTNTSVSNVITITVPHNAPNTLYYYCTAHASAMNGSISVTTDETKADLYAWKNVLALPLIDNGAGGTTQDFSNQINAGSTTKASTTTGNTNSTSAQSVFYSRSFILDGNGDDIRVPDTADFTFGSGDFTIEGWAHQTANSSWRSFVMKYTTNNASSSWFYGFLDGTQYFYFYHGASAGVFFASSDGTVSGTVKPIPLNTWVHCAVTRSGNVFRMFENGVQVCTMTVNETNNDSSARLSIGQDADGNYDFAGYFSDVRVYKGVAKYTSNFIPASTFPDILPDTPSGVSGDSKLAKVTDGAVSFDDIGDYLYLGTSSDFTMAGDFTVEAFAYVIDAGINCFFNVGDYINSTSFVFYQHSGFLRVYTNNALAASGGAVALNAWNHVALVRSGSTCTLYLNGKSVATFTNSATFSGDVNIGVDYYNSNRSAYTSGFISNLRYINGTALYTANFTPPTRELTNVTNTKLLCCQSNKAPGDATIAPLVSGVNSGTNWSAYLSGGGGFQASYPVTNAFNGVTTGANTSRSVDSQTTQTFTPPGGISYSSSVEVWTWMAGTVSLNGGSNIAVSNDQSFRQIASGSGTIDSISFTSASGNNVYIAGIKVDGTILVDPITPYGDPAATNFNPFTTDINAVRGQETGYCTWNPLTTPTNTNYSDGNLTINKTGGSHSSSYATMGMTTGKWYWEISKLTSTGDGGLGMGLVRDNQFHLPASTSGTDRYLIYLQSNIIYYYDGDSTELNFSSTPAFNDYPGTFMFAFDADNQKLYFGKDGSWTNGTSGLSGGNPSIGSGPLLDGFNAGETYFPWCTPYTSGQNMGANFGQKPFKYAPPDGFQPLNAANAKPVKVFARPDQFVGVTTYAGDGTSVVVSDYQFKPDFVWIKGYTDPDRHGLYDTVRGAQKRLQSANNNAEDTVNGVMSFDDRGFSVGNYSDSNGSGRGYVAWSWRAGGSKNTFNKDDVGYASAAAAGLTGGDIAPVAASVGTKQGFSIIQYQGNGSRDQSIPHGLTQAPDFSIIKNMDGTANWTVFHRSVTTTNQKVFYLNTTAAVADYSNGSYTWWHQLPGASLFYIGDLSTAINNGTNDMISYHWHDVPGLQKFGKYTANNNADGPYIELGFRPAVIIIRCSSATGHWLMYDNERNLFNLTNNKLAADLDDAENASNVGAGDLNGIDFLSNGFKCRTNTGSSNSSGTYTFAAWAEAPTFNLFGAQSNAR